MSEVRDVTPVPADVHILELLWIRFAATSMAGEGTTAFFDHESAATYARTLDRVIRFIHAWEQGTCPPTPAPPGASSP